VDQQNFFDRLSLSAPCRSSKIRRKFLGNNKFAHEDFKRALENDKPIVKTLRCGRVVNVLLLFGEIKRILIALVKFVIEQLECRVPTKSAQKFNQNLYGSSSTLFAIN
jgi:hypothetical protein